MGELIKNVECKGYLHFFIINNQYDFQ